RVCVRRDDARLRARRGDPLPRVAERPRVAPLAGVPAGARFRVGSLAVGPLGRRRRLVLALGARGLAAPLGGGALGRWARAARVRDLAARARAAAPGL